MSIEKITDKLEGSLSTANAKPIIKNRAYLGSYNDTTSFTGVAANAVPKAEKALDEFLLDLMPKSTRVMVKIRDKMGEIQNQLINAFGTGAIAPLLIMFNPISKTDGDTRTYTAWRQPISAVLAVATQCAIVIPFNALIRWMSDIGYLGEKFNMSLFPSDDFAKSAIKAANPGKNFTKEEMKAEIKKFNAEKKKALKESILQDKIVFTKTNRKGEQSTFEMSPEKFKNLFSETLDKIINEEKAQRAVAVDTKYTKTINRNIFYYDHGTEAKEVLERVAAKLEEAKKAAPNFEEQNVSKICNTVNKEIKQIISELKADAKTTPSKKGTNAELINILKELKEKIYGKDSVILDIFSEKVNSRLDTINKISKMNSTKEVVEYVQRSITRRTDSIDTVIKTLESIKTKLASEGGISVKDAQEFVSVRIKELEDSLKAELKGKGLSEADILDRIKFSDHAGKRLKQKAGDIATSIADVLKKHAKSNVDGMKRWTGLGVSLAILPLTCWLLNKIYPKFMDLVFPNLSQKTGKSNNKPGKDEVK